MCDHFLDVIFNPQPPLGPPGFGLLLLPVAVGGRVAGFSHFCPEHISVTTGCIIFKLSLQQYCLC